MFFVLRILVIQEDTMRMIIQRSEIYILLAEPLKNSVQPLLLARRKQVLPWYISNIVVRR